MTLSKIEAPTIKETDWAGLIKKVITDPNLNAKRANLISHLRQSDNPVVINHLVRAASEVKTLTEVARTQEDNSARESHLNQLLYAIQSAFDYLANSTNPNDIKVLGPIVDLLRNQDQKKTAEEPPATSSKTLVTAAPEETKDKPPNIVELPSFPLTAIKAEVSYVFGAPPRSSRGEHRVIAIGYPDYNPSTPLDVNGAETMRQLSVDLDNRIALSLQYLTWTIEYNNCPAGIKELIWPVAHSIENEVVARGPIIHISHRDGHHLSANYAVNYLSSTLGLIKLADIEPGMSFTRSGDGTLEVDELPKQNDAISQGQTALFSSTLLAHQKPYIPNLETISTPPLPIEKKPAELSFFGRLMKKIKKGYKEFQLKPRQLIPHFRPPVVEVMGIKEAAEKLNLVEWAQKPSTHQRAKEIVTIINQNGKSDCMLIPAKDPETDKPLTMAQRCLLLDLVDYYNRKDDDKRSRLSANTYWSSTVNRASYDAKNDDSRKYFKKYISQFKLFLYDGNEPEGVPDRSLIVKTVKEDDGYTLSIVSTATDKK